MDQRIRIKAIAAVIRPRDGALLVFRGKDRITGEVYARPLGGSVEWGERAEDALRREFREELDCELVDIELLTVSENIFQLNGEGRHQIVFLFQAQPADTAIFDQDEIDVLDAPGVVAVWRPPHDPSSRLVPAELAEVLPGQA